MDASRDGPSASSRKAPVAFDELLRVVERLRDPGGCPWDQEQTHRSLRPYLLEETYELLEAIDAGDSDGIAEELGDLLVHVAFHSDMAGRAGQFTAADVIDHARRKLIGRHPHVFGNGEKLRTAREVVERWDELKRVEKGEKTSVADSLPTAMPALAYAAAIQQRAERAGVPWREGNSPKILPDTARDSIASAAKNETAEQAAGLLLFQLVAELRDLGIDPETALRGTALRFRERVRRMEDAAGESGLTDLGEARRERMWKEARGNG